MQMKTFSNSPTNFNWMYDTDWNLSGRKVFFSFESNKNTLTFNNDRRKVDRSTGKKRVESIIDYTTDFKSIVKSRHDFTVKSSALDLRLILLSNQLRINN